MMKWCCLIVFIFFTIGVSKGGILSGKCHASNGTCGLKGVQCNVTFGSGWMYNGKCCNNRPCCKLSKPPCIQETACLEGYRLLPNQASSDHCYKVFNQGTHNQGWVEAAVHCAKPPNGYSWRPNTAQEANAVRDLFNLPNDTYIWTGANDWDKTGNYTFHIENSPFSFNSLPFGLGEFDPDPDILFGVMIKFDTDRNRWLWKNRYFGRYHLYVCEYKRPCR
ncbi:uncharacterized protein LOC134700112 [Mytilus trossulus]|uniref:uncharacterized protein LOC134694784 n=1 Tax=Mytilus trossulus TaxID=6551 RepID=UPI00300751C6